MSVAAEQKMATVPLSLSGMVSSVLEIEGQRGKIYNHMILVASDDKYAKPSQFAVESESVFGQPGEEVSINAEMQCSCFDRPFTYNEQHKKAGQQGLYRETKTRIRYLKRLQ